MELLLEEQKALLVSQQAEGLRHYNILIILLLFKHLSLIQPQRLPKPITELLHRPQPPNLHPIYLICTPIQFQFNQQFLSLPTNQAPKYIPKMKMSTVNLITPLSQPLLTPFCQMHKQHIPVIQHNLQHPQVPSAQIQPQFLPLRLNLHISSITTINIFLGIS